MRRPTLRIGFLAAALALASGAAAVRGQNPPIGQNLAAQLRWLQLSVVGGRMTLLSDQINNLAETQAKLRDRQERLRIGVADGLPSIGYELTGKDVEFQLEINQREKIEIRRRSLGEEPASSLEFIQQPGRNVTLEVTSDGQTERRDAPTLWHLWLADPELCRKNLEPLLKILAPGWKLDADAEQITRLLLAGAEDSAPRSQEWDALVAQLGDPQYARREAADRQLREAGQAALPYLTMLDPRELDAEQRFRIRRIVSRLQTDTQEDTPERAAAWLRADPRIWLALARRPELETRATAGRQLQALLGADVVFDAAADPPTREAQLLKIAERLPKEEERAAE